ncbi:diacylglycerol kinase family protein [Gammaproteobacteria bacterium AB-CW1]|uniref:Diacylglycerol kinase family protein n=1 Tax=Natronospira elongata TaxID=3110268 RepID=A0AAP6JEQ0_9GAMM|nr:diacylglycerol kinase family protein [Gammaproteobacteria bacterium AB-CW1]
MSLVDIILNPAAGGGRAGKFRDSIDTHLRSLDFEPRWHLTESPGHGIELAREVVESGSRLLATAGGDGTLFEVINGCLQSEGPLPDLALIPVGRGNDFAKSLGLPREWADACDRLMLGTKRRVDMGQCNDIFFANTLGIGLDADIADIASRRRWLPGDTAYVAALAQSLLRKRRPRVSVRHDGGNLEQEVTLMVIANGCYEGGRFNLAPHANIEDGQLDLIITPSLSRRQIMALAPLVTEGRVEEIEGYQRFLTRRASIHLDAPCRVHADGEVIYRQARRLEIGVLPGALTFFS